MPPATRQLRRRDLADAVATLSEPTPFEAANARDIDLFIAVLGFEDRALSIPETLAAAKVTSATGAVFRYGTNADDNEQNWPAMENAFAELGTNGLATLQAGVHASQDLRRLLATLDSGARVVWDISVASNDLIIEGLGALLDADVELELLYAEAQSYRPTAEEFESERDRFVGTDRMGLDEGVLDVFTSGEFNGNHSTQLPNELVVFPGFSRDRVRATISKLETDWIIAPDRAPLVWMIGTPPHGELAWRGNALREVHGLDGQSSEVHELSTFDYRETLRALEEVYQRRCDCVNLTVSALGSKMQALGIALFCWARPAMRVLLARPRMYNASAYSRGTRAIWTVQLGHTSELTNHLRDVGTLELL